MLIIEEIIREVRIHSPPWAAKTLVRTSFCLREPPLRWLKTRDLFSPPDHGTEPSLSYHLRVHFFVLFVAAFGNADADFGVYPCHCRQLNSPYLH